MTLYKDEADAYIAGFLSHIGERTVQDVINEMSTDQRDLMYLIVGAAVEDEDLSGEADVVQAYTELSDEQKNLIDFIVGAALSESAPLTHAEEADNIIAHHGVKGQKWGVRKSDVTGAGGLSKSAANNPANRKAAREAVKGGTATLGDAHLAGLKSTGHRVANGFLGDKTYWKRTAQIAGLTLAGVAAAVAIPAVMPAGVLAAVGAHVGTSGGFGTIALAGGKAALGQQMLTHLGVMATSTAGNVAGLGTLVTNTGRAIRGNARINKSAAALGNLLNARQTAGNERTRKVLNTSGSIGKKKLKHGDLTVEEASSMTSSADLDIVGDFLAHHGVKGQRWGIRRKRTSDGTVTGVGDDKKEVVDTQSPGHTGGTGNPHLSADAERVLNTMSKPKAEMSTREMKEAVERHRQVEAYNKLFDPQASGHSDLQAKVERLRLEKEYRGLVRDSTPPSKTQRFVKGAVTGFNAYRQVDKVLGGTLSAGLTKKLGLVQTSQLDKLTSENSLLKAKNKNITELAEFDKLSKLHSSIIAASPTLSPPKPPAPPVMTAPSISRPTGGAHKQTGPVHINSLSKPLKKRHKK